MTTTPNNPKLTSKGYTNHGKPRTPAKVSKPGGSAEDGFTASQQVASNEPRTGLKAGRTDAHVRNVGGFAKTGQKGGGETTWQRNERYTKRLYPVKSNGP